MAKPTKSLDLLVTLQGRFEANHPRHPAVAWATVQHRLAGKPDKLAVLRAMEDSGGEPDLVDVDAATGELLFVDCSAESPTGRRSLCYDREARLGRKENRPEGSAVEMAARIGVELLTEAQYRHLQTLGPFDTKTSSWVQTPADIRKLGGALFCDRRYAHVFVYHNGAESYYAARGFRGALRV
jgi:hypothetical protein